MARIIITENQEKLIAKSIKQMVNESQESKSIDAAKKLLISKGYDLNTLNNIGISYLSAKLAISSEISIPFGK